MSKKNLNNSKNNCGKSKSKW